jgi:hypothetical protein
LWCFGGEIAVFSEQNTTHNTLNLKIKNHFMVIVVFLQKHFLQNTFLKIMTPLLDRMKNSGFEIELDDDGFTVSPSEKLTDQQREFLKANKPQIMAELLLTTVYNLNGAPMQIQAKDAAHKAWLIKVNHNSPIPIPDVEG